MASANERSIRPSSPTSVPMRPQHTRVIPVVSVSRSMDRANGLVVVRCCRGPQVELGPVRLYFPPQCECAECQHGDHEQFLYHGVRIPPASRTRPCPTGPALSDPCTLASRALARSAHASLVPHRCRRFVHLTVGAEH